MIPQHHIHISIGHYQSVYDSLELKRNAFRGQNLAIGITRPDHGLREFLYHIFIIIFTELKFCHITP